MAHITMCEAAIRESKYKGGREIVKRLTFGLQVEVVPEVVVCALACRNLIVRLGLHGVHEIGELHSFLDKEDGNVVSDEIPVTLLGIKLDGKSSNIANGILFKHNVSKTIIVCVVKCNIPRYHGIPAQY